MAPKDYDFCGWVTKNDIPCSDGRTIRQDAFAHQDGMKVPMVYMHNHEDPTGVIGYTILENRPEGVFGYSFCNNSDYGRQALEMVQHGDIDSYSIYANHLKERGADVVHGNIREVSLVLAGANDGARIMDVNLTHGDDFKSDEAIIVTGDSDMALKHSDNSEESEESALIEAIESLNEDQMAAFAYMIEIARQDAFEEAGYNPDAVEEDETEDEYDDQIDDSESEEIDEVEPALAHNDNEGEDTMRTNIFDQTTVTSGGVLTHYDLANIIDSAKSTRSGSLKDCYLAACDDLGLSHSDADAGITRSEDKQDYGVNDPSFLFPEYHNLNRTPDWIKRDMEWVSTFMSGTKHVPFARIKSQFADITADEARAKGYIKGDKKENEVFTLLKRQTDPQTIYKHQQFDRDDIIDIIDFDVIAWIKGEMRMMLNEEIARAALVGDGRLSSAKDKIQENHVRPIWGDDSLFTIYKQVAIDPADTGDDKTKTANNFIKTAIRARKEYKGSGNPILFTTEEWLTEMLLIEDSMGRSIYKTEAELATKMRVSKIVTVPVMENLTAKNGKKAIGIILNLSDYVFGADKGGAVELFDDFDIDFNQYKYLIETRCSGALVKPYSAICLEIADSQAAG